MRLRVYTRAYTRAVNVPRRGPQVFCEAFWTLSRNAEWVMHPAQARRRQMNYNISFSRPYIPTDKAYWRSLIAFNSLLVHPCNGLRLGETHSRRYDRYFCLLLFLPSISELPFCPLRAFPPPPLHSVDLSDIASLSRLLLLLLFSFFPPFFSLCDDAIV